MTRLRLRAELLISTLLVICPLLAAILVIGRQMIRSEIAGQVQQNTIASLRAFEAFQRQQATELSRTANLLAELPTLKALMTTNDELTIQDASNTFWKLAGSDLLLLANSQKKAVGFHVSKPGWTADIAERDLRQSLGREQDSAWWYAGQQLYLVFLRPITEGTGREQNTLGTLAVGFRVSSDFASELALVTGSQVVIEVDGQVIASSLPPAVEAQFGKWVAGRAANAGGDAQEVNVGNEQYELASRSLDENTAVPIVFHVLKPMQETNLFIRGLNRIILALGISALLLAAIVLSIVSRTITRPLDNLVAGVRALAAGDYTYSVTPRGSVEVAELGAAFSKMRTDLLRSQQRQIASERITALGRAASSISHDLRHYLAAVVANAEFLYEADRLKLNKDEIYEEIKAGSDQMIDLLDSLRELAREEVSISPVVARLDQTVRRAVEAVRSLPEFRVHVISIQAEGPMEGSFDPKKIERVFFNLALNACQATLQREGTIQIEILSVAESFDVRVCDNGNGVPESIHGTLFDPFVSFGKSNSTGLGLAIASKIVHDHGGSIVLERTSEAGTVFLVRLPRLASVSPQQHPQNISS